MIILADTVIEVVILSDFTSCFRSKKFKIDVICRHVLALEHQAGTSLTLIAHGLKSSYSYSYSSTWPLNWTRVHISVQPLCRSMQGELIYWPYLINGDLPLVDPVSDRHRPNNWQVNWQQTASKNMDKFTALYMLHVLYAITNFCYACCPTSKWKPGAGTVAEVNMSFDSQPHYLGELVRVWEIQFSHLICFHF